MFYISIIVKAKTKNSINKANLIKKRTIHLIKMTIIPHKKNDYRPHLIRSYGLVAIIFTVIGLQFGYNGAISGGVLGDKADITINSLFEQTNKVRVEYGKDKLKLSDKLNKAAYLKAQNMLELQYWAHNSPDGTQPWKWLGDVDYNYSEAGENLAKNFKSTSAIMTAWMNSTGHKDNLLNSNYKEVGFSVLDGELDGQPTILVVALYGAPVENSVLGAKISSPVGQTSIITRFAIAIQSMSLAGISGLSILMFAIVVAGLSHTYRQKLPKHLRNTAYRHHGAYKAIGLTVFSLIMIFFYSGGQV